MHTYKTSMLWSVDRCQNRVSTDQYHLTVSRAQVSTHQGQVFFEVIRRQVTSFHMIAGSSLFFFKFIWNMSCISTAEIKFWFQTELGHENSPAIIGREDSSFWLCSSWSRVGYALHPIFMLWLVKIWQVSSCAKFMQHLESCLLWQLKLTEFCVNLWCF